MRRWVLDTSPLVFLAKIDRLGLLRSVADEFLLPPAVWEEIRARNDDATEHVGVALEAGWLELRIPTLEWLHDVAFQLGPGETEVLALARELEADRVVMDDLRARRVARHFGLLPVGTLGILLGARLRGEIASMEEEIQRLKKAGFRAGKPLVEAILRSAGELQNPVEPGGEEPR